jgi:hypothetical protein
MSNIVNGEFLMDSVVNALKERQKEGNEDKTFFHALLRREVGLYKIESEGSEADHSEMYTTEDLIEFFSNVSQIIHEKEYISKDAIMLRVGVPENYKVIPARIFINDIPMQFYRQINCQPINVAGNQEKQVIYICEAVSPARLNAKVLANYQCITVKIDRQTLALKSWVPGVDQDAGYHHVNNPLILVGKHLTKAEKATEIQRRQSLGQAVKKQKTQEVKIEPVTTPTLTLSEILK